MRCPRTLALLSALGLLSACADAVVEPEATVPAAGERTAQGPLLTGWIWRAGATLPLEVRYEERDGLAIWQGDIIIGKAGEVPATLQALRARMGGGPRLGLGISPGSGRWPLGIVPYVIDPGLANASRVTNAIAHIESQWGYVDFVPRTSETDYVYVTTASGAGDCATAVGRQGGPQVVYLGVNCTQGNATHELLHTLGMHHEQNRCDRDTYLTIKWANMRDPAEPYYAKACDGYDEYGAYDYGSMMHYGPYADSQNGQRTLEPKPFSSSNLNKMGQRSGLSTRDRTTVSEMYPRLLGPTGLAVSYPGNVPSLSWNPVSGASYYAVELTQRYEESDYERGYTSWEAGSLVGNTTGTSLTDTSNPYTGQSVCNVYSNAYGYSDYSYYYDVYAVFPNGKLSWNSRVPAEVGPC